MKTPIHVITLSFLLMGMPLFINTSKAASPGVDSADQAGYKDGWSSGSNGGSGFKGWNLIASTTTGACGFFIGDSKNVGGGSGADINVNGKSFGMFGKGMNNSAEAYRSLDSALKVGQTLSFDFAVNFRSGLKGVDLRNVGDEKIIFNFNVGADDYVVNNATTGNGSIGNDYSQNTLFTLSFTQKSDTGGTWKITRSGGVSKIASGTYAGVAEGFKFYAFGTDDGSENDLYINNLAVTSPGSPVPSVSPKPTPKPRSAEDAVTPVVKDPNRHAEFLYRIKEGEIGLLFLGDSITDFWPRRGEWSWQKFAQYHPADFGISADRTEHVLWRISNGELEQINPKVVVIMVGTNNIGQIPEETPEWAANGVKKIVDTVHGKLPKTKVLLLAVFPCGLKNSPQRQKVEQMNQILAKLGDNNRTTFLDIGGKFLDEKGEIPSDIMPDKLHPTAKGYDLWYEAIHASVVEMMK